MDNSFVYKIAGHFIEIVWNLPEGQKWHLPGFLPFLNKNLDNATEENSTKICPDKKLVTVNIIPLDENNQIREQKDLRENLGQEAEKEIFGRRISAFDIENGKCELRKKDNTYNFLVISFEGNLSIRLEMNKKQPSMTCRCALYEQKPKAAVPDPHHLRFALWMGLAFAGIPKWTTAIHASVIIHDNQAVLFLGESGTGKSTHTRLWLENIPGSRLLNDDSPMLRLHKSVDQPEYPHEHPHKHPHKHPHEHTLYIYGSPWSGKGQVYRNECYPVASIVRLQQAPFNRSTRLTVVQGFAALYPSFPPAYLKDEDLHEDICTVISETLKTIPVYRLECLPKPSAATQIYQKIFGGDEEKGIP